MRQAEKQKNGKRINLNYAPRCDIIRPASLGNGLDYGVIACGVQYVIIAEIKSHVADALVTAKMRAVGIGKKQ